MAKRAKRVARRKVRRAKVKASVEQWREQLADVYRRITRIEEFLEPDLSEFHEKQKIAADPLAATVGTG